MLPISFLGLVLAGCATTQGSYQALSGSTPSRPADCQVEVFRDAKPQRPYVEVSHLNVHLEKTFFAPSDFDDAKAELKHQACLSGADAIIEVRELSSSYLETRIFNVSGIGVRFQDSAQP